ncbi:MAG: hypothetical protein HY843_00550 [Bdellovibrio sp.]|nr:hypothetical protein [Bdellovibrio sp.]
MFSYRLSTQQELKELKKIQNVLFEFQETLESGLVLNQDQWSKLQTLKPPWGVLAFESLKELRAQGGALLPTIKRIRKLAQEHSEFLKEARAKSVQALAQSVVCAALVPLFGVSLYLLLPAIKIHYGLWICVCGFSVALSLCAAIWLMKISERARWGGLRGSERAWILSSQCALERFLAFVRTGIPVDLAWTKSCEKLYQESPELSEKWGFSIWDPPHNYKRSDSARAYILNLGDQARKILSQNIVEGRPCLEQIETLLISFRDDLRANIQKELAILPVQALKPLFFCVAPSLFGLLATGLYLSFLEIGLEGFL